MQDNTKNYGILFDLDGTLVDSLSDICGHLNRVRAFYGLPALPEAHLRLFIGKGIENLIKGGFKEMAPEQMPDVINLYRDYYLEQPGIHGSLYPGVRETLDTLRNRSGLSLGIVTNKSTDVAIKTVEHYLPGFRFDIVAGPELVSQKKPSPLALLETMAKLGGLQPGNTWFVGDDPVDRQCAESSGVNFLAAGYGFGGVTAEPARRLGAFPDLLEKIPVW